DSKRSDTKKKKNGGEEASLGPPSDKEMKNLKRKSEMMEVKKENDDDKDDKEKKEEKDKTKETMAADGIPTTENSPLLKSEEKTKEAQSGQELVPGESRQSGTGIKGMQLIQISYTTILAVFVEMVLCISAFVCHLQKQIPVGPTVIIAINLSIIFLSTASLLIVLFSRFHVSLLETDTQYKYAVTCVRRFLLFSSHSLRLFLSLCTLTQSAILDSWILFGLSIPLTLLSSLHIAFSLKMHPVVPSPC
ncbi:hypothetical protein PMAYCL1PPCAC_12461, partial [Pristionchus mayeri]